MVVGVRVEHRGAVPEVSEGLAALGSPQENGVGAGGRAESKLVEGDALPAGSQDAGLGSLGEAQSANRQFRNLEQAYIVGDLGNNDGNLAVLPIHELGQARQGNGRSIDLGLVKPLENSGAEGASSSAAKEAVQLDEQALVRILALYNLGGTLVADAAPSSFQINSHLKEREKEGRDLVRREGECQENCRGRQRKDGTKRTAKARGKKREENDRNNDDAKGAQTALNRSNNEGRRTFEVFFFEACGGEW